MPRETYFISGDMGNPKKPDFTITPGSDGFYTLFSLTGNILFRGTFTECEKEMKQTIERRKLKQKELDDLIKNTHHYDADGKEI